LRLGVAARPKVVEHRVAARLNVLGSGTAGKPIRSIFKGIPKSLGLNVAARSKIVGHKVAARPNALGSGTVGKPKLGFGHLLLVYWAK